MTTEKITVTFEGWDEERIVEAVAQKLAEKTDARVKEQVQKLVEAAVAKATVPGLTGDLRFDPSRQRADAGLLFQVASAGADAFAIRAVRP